MSEFFAGMLTMFVVGEIGFFVFLGCTLWLMAWAVEAMFSKFATIVFLLAAFLIATANGVNLIDTVWNNPFQTVGWLFGYVVIGVLWTFFKYDRFAAKCARAIKEWKDRHGDKWQRHINIAASERDPRPEKNKERIMLWLMYWPFSMLHDLVTDFYDVVYSTISDRLNAIMVRRLGTDVMKELE